MKAIFSSTYGQPGSLTIKELEKPVPKENEVLVKICATAVNDYDWSMVRGKPYVYRLIFGLLKPKHPIPGMELSGVVESVGAGVSVLNAGDAVYGDISGYGFGTYAEYIAINAEALAKKPGEMSFEDAASIPHAALLALQGIRDVGKIQKKEKVLINGAGGGVGCFALQLAKLHECEVTGVDSGEKLEKMRAMGFDRVIDYRNEDFTRIEEKFDLVLDCKTNRSPFTYPPCLKPNGRYVTIGGQVSRLLQVLIFGKIVFLFTKKKLSILALKSNKGLDEINTLYLQGKIKPVIDGPYPLAEAPKMMQYFGEGRHQGKVVLKIG